MIDTILAISAATWGVVMGFAPVLQIRRMMREQSSKDVSMAYFAVLMFGFLLWFAYGLSVANPVLIVPNVVAITMCGATIVVAARYRRRRDVGLSTQDG